MTKLKITLMGLAAIALSTATIFGAIWVSHIETRKAEAAFPVCRGKHTAHLVKVEGNKVVPEHTTAKRCDTLTIINLDDQDRIIAFGRHDHHTAYDGVTERYLNQNGKFSVRLVEPGNFRFHDHEQEGVWGTFSVTAEP